MQDQALGTFVILGGVGLMLLTITLLSTVYGMAITSVAMLAVGSGFFAIAKGGIHEATGGIFFVGAIISAGFASLAINYGSRTKDNGTAP